MSFETVRNKAQTALIESGRAVMHSLSPNDFEYYAISFELVDSSFNSLRIFNMPVLPNAISINRTSPITTKKTALGYFSVFSDAFQAKTITLQGTFGRKFRLLVTSKKGEDGKKDFDLKVKTGYGASKILESILDESQTDSESGDKKFLILYNLTFNQQLVVEVLSHQFNQSLENNAMWNYNIELKAVADVTRIKGNNSDKSLKSLLKTSVLNKTINNVFSNLTFGGLVDSKNAFKNPLTFF